MIFCLVAMTFCCQNRPFPAETGVPICTKRGHYGPCPNKWETIFLAEIKSRSLASFQRLFILSKYHMF